MDDSYKKVGYYRGIDLYLDGILRCPMEVLTLCDNTRVDTAFMHINNIKLLIENGFLDRILFGTDAPINRLYFKDQSTADYIKGIIDSMKKELSRDIVDKIFSNKIYG